MKIEDKINYTIMSNHLDNNFLNFFKDYTIINDDTTYDELENMIYSFPSKTIVLNDVLRKLKSKEKEKVIELLNTRGVNFINITSNINEVCYGDYIYVFYNDKIVIEGQTLDVLKEEKILKRLGFGLPFTVDLSMQLKLYNVIDEIETDMEKLVDILWN